MRLLGSNAFETTHVDEVEINLRKKGASPSGDTVKDHG